MAEALRDMRLFVAVYEERSFTAAAQREHATQSGVSHHIRQLEDRRGTRLFNRGTGLAVSPTPAGDAYYRGCIATLRAHDEANRALDDFRGAASGDLAVGLVPTVSRTLLAPALARFVTAFPNVNIRTIEAPSLRLISEVRGGEIDVAIGFALPGEVGVRTTPFVRTPCYLVSRHRGSRSTSAAASLSEITPLKLVAPPHPNAIRMSIEAALGANGVHIDRWLEVDSMDATLEFVSRSDWYSIVPGLVLLPERRLGRIATSRLKWPDISLELSLIEPLRRPKSPVADAFVAALLAEIESSNSGLVERAKTRGVRQDGQKTARG